jgi:transposase InsO family protein
MTIFCFGIFSGGRSNACAESFFKTLKTEEEKLNGKYSADDVRQAVFFYVEGYYTSP